MEETSPMTHFIMSLHRRWIAVFFLINIWIFSDAFSKAFGTWYWPLVGVIFTPFTTLWVLNLQFREYTNPVWLVGLPICLLLDFVNFHQEKKEPEPLSEHNKELLQELGIPVPSDEPA